MSRINEFVQDQNDTSDTFASSTISQRELFQHFAAEAAPPQIDLLIPLTHYGRTEDPLFAVYGQLSAVEISKWYKEHGNKLFAGNIRHFVGLNSDVNAEISKTLIDNPEAFWYYNNGITILTQEISRRPGPVDKSTGMFDCKRVTVVNGAQTVGTIGRSNLADNCPAVVQARIILVEDPDAQTGRTITRASNTQNRIDARNFVALDPVQDRIRSELLLDGINYEFREGEPSEASSSSFDFIDAIVTQACSSNEVSYVALAKGYIGGLYTDINTAPYKSLFNAGTSSKRLWTLVQLTRRVDQSIKAHFEDPSPAERGIIVHGNRFSLHCILRRLGYLRPIVPGVVFSDLEVAQACTTVTHGMRDIIDTYYDGAYLAPLFKNVSKCTDVRNRLDKLL